MPTKDELERENAELRDRVAELEAGAATAGPKRLPRPDFLSAGEVDDLKNHGTTISPFDGRLLNALDEGVEPGNPEARARAEKERAKRQKKDAEPVDEQGDEQE